jgi:hypothetical protein
MARCPWFRDGKCYSPKTINEYGVPSPLPTSKGYCNSPDYRRCPYYVEGEEHEESLMESLGLDIKEGFYIPIHKIPCNTASKCPFFKTVQYGTFCAAKCLVTGKFITRSNVKKCIENWKDCPFYKIGLEMYKS